MLKARKKLIKNKLKNQRLKLENKGFLKSREKLPLEKRTKLLEKTFQDKRSYLLEKHRNNLFSSILSNLKKIAGKKYPSFPKFPDVQKITGRVVAKVKFPSLQKIAGQVKVNNFPKIQKISGSVKVENQQKEIKVSNLGGLIAKLEQLIKKPSYQAIQPVKLDNPDDIKFPDSLKIDNLPNAEGQTPSRKADPTKYIPVRITDGKRFNDGGFGGGAVISGGSGGSSLSESWNSSSKTVGTSSVKIVSANQMRKLLVIANDSNNTIYLSFGTTAVVNKGIRLNANGGTYEISSNNMFKGSVFAIADSGSTNNVCLLEVTKSLGS